MRYPPDPVPMDISCLPLVFLSILQHRISPPPRESPIICTALDILFSAPLYLRYVGYTSYSSHLLVSLVVAHRLPLPLYPMIWIRSCVFPVWTQNPLYRLGGGCFASL